MSINRPLQYIFLLILLLNITARGKLTIPWASAAVILQNNNNDYDYLDTMLGGDVNNFQYNFLNEGDDMAELDAVEEIKTAGAEAFADIQPSSFSAAVPSNRNVQQTSEFNQYVDIPAEKRRDYKFYEQQPQQKQQQQNALYIGGGGQSMEDHQTTSSEQQDAIDHVTNLIKSMREHAIAIIKDMNDLETDFLGSSDDGKLNNIDSGNNNTATGSSTSSQCGLDNGMRGNGGTSGGGGANGGGDFSMDPTTTTTPNPCSASQNSYSNQYGSKDTNKNSYDVNGGSNGNGFNSCTNNSSSVGTASNSLGSNNGNDNGSDSKSNNSNGMCINPGWGANNNNNNNTNNNKGSEPIFVLNEWSLPTLANETPSLNANEFMVQAQEAVRSWKEQIEACKRVLDATVAQAAQVNGVGELGVEVRPASSPTSQTNNYGSYQDALPLVSNKGITSMGNNIALKAKSSPPFVSLEAPASRLLHIVGNRDNPPSSFLSNGDYNYNSGTAYVNEHSINKPRQRKFVGQKNLLRSRVSDFPTSP